LYIKGTREKQGGGGRGSGEMEGVGGAIRKSHAVPCRGDYHACCAHLAILDRDYHA